MMTTILNFNFLSDEAFNTQLEIFKRLGWFCEAFSDKDISIALPADDEYILNYMIDSMIKKKRGQ